MKIALSHSALVLVVYLGLAVSDEPGAEPADEAQPEAASDLPAPDFVGELPAPELNLDVEYARARLELAEANLQRVEDRNVKVKNSVSPNVVAEYQRDVEVARAALADATRGESDDFDAWLLSAAARWKSAHTAWKSAEAANKRKEGTVPEIDVERMRLRAEMLRINLERGRLLVDGPREAQLQWRLSTLDDQVHELAEVVFRTSPVMGSSPRIWYYYELR